MSHVLTHDSTGEARVFDSFWNWVYSTRHPCFFRSDPYDNIPQTIRLPYMFVCATQGGPLSHNSLSRRVPNCPWPFEICQVWESGKLAAAGEQYSWQFCCTLSARKYLLDICWMCRCHNGDKSVASNWPARFQPHFVLRLAPNRVSCFSA